MIKQCVYRCKWVVEMPSPSRSNALHESYQALLSGVKPYQHDPWKAFTRMQRVNNEVSGRCVTVTVVTIKKRGHNIPYNAL